MNLSTGTRLLLASVTVAGSALVAPAMALAETPANEDPIGPDNIANPTENPEPDPCDEPGDCFAIPTENPDPVDPDPVDPGTDVEPQADVDEPVLANPTFTG